MRPSESRQVDVNLEGWMMNIYQIYSAVDNKDAYADLKQADRKIIDFINYNEGRYTNEAVFCCSTRLYFYKHPPNGLRSNYSQNVIVF